MALTTSSLMGEFAEALATNNAALSNTLRVALPGIIQSFDPQTVTCAVAPAIRGAQFARDGTVSQVNYPLLVDVPVVFPHGGGCSLTFPLKAGDECLVIFADRAIDFWWQSGGIQEPVDARQHSLSDAFVLPGPQSQAKKISGISTSAVQLRSEDGKAFVELDPSSHSITLATPGKLTATAASIDLTGEVNIKGNVTVSGDVTASGISLTNHRHGGVQSGGANTGGPV
ncbi:MULTISPECIES: Gp138 family membrane-puncturing spike protein [unclassified Cedecea]|uniref:Gp138 family membrane-puncturing spike protein n=1 Tax=unclassified Cedecea TaxID=2649846 RepID=UPI003015974B